MQVATQCDETVKMWYESDIGEILIEVNLANFKNYISRQLPFVYRIAAFLLSRYADIDTILILGTSE